MTGDPAFVDEPMACTRSPLNSVISELETLLEEMADVEADTPWSVPAMPAVVVCDRLTDLGQQLRLMFDQEEQDGRFPSLLASRPDLHEDVQLLLREHRLLLTQFDHLCELSGTSVRPRSTWGDIALQFRRFKQALAIHQAWEDTFLQDSLPAGSTVLV
jgi:hypothetical protein